MDAGSNGECSGHCILCVCYCVLLCVCVCVRVCDWYRNTGRVRWNYVVSNLFQVLASLFYMYYIFERFCIPMFRNFTSDYVTPRRLIVSVFGCILPGTLVLFIGKSLPCVFMCVCAYLSRCVYRCCLAPTLYHCGIVGNVLHLASLTACCSTFKQ